MKWRDLFEFRYQIFGIKLEVRSNRHPGDSMEAKDRQRRNPKYDPFVDLLILSFERQKLRKEGLFRIIIDQVFSAANLI